MQPHDTTNQIPYGYCHCGCGQKTNVAPHNIKSRGIKGGEHYKYITGHNNQSPYNSISEQFWHHCIKGNSHDCWRWGSKATRNGYPVFTYKRKVYYAHRISWEIHNRFNIPKGMYICHTCDNPICTNPKHLFLGTPQDNVDDMIKKGRKNKPKSR